MQLPLHSTRHSFAMLPLLRASPKRRFSLKRTFLLFICLLTFSYAQRFPSGVGIDWSEFNASAPCLSALNSTIQCNDTLLVAYDYSPSFSDSQLSALCADRCWDSLLTTRSDIAASCSASTDVVVDENSAYLPTYILDDLISTFNMTCLRDSTTGKFCASVFQSWENVTQSTSAQNCSDCTLRTYQVQLSNYNSYSDDLAEEFASLKSSCSATGYSYVSPTPVALNDTVNATQSSAPVSTTSASCSDTYRIQAGDDCHKISLAHNVSTYFLTHYNELQAYCEDFPTSGEICLPEPCEIYTVKKNDTCYSIAKSQPSFVTITQLLSWNPNINKLCRNLDQFVGDQICVGPPGGYDILNDPTATITSGATTAASVPTNVAANVTKSCAQYHSVAEGDTCASISVSSGISLDDFYFLNPSVDSNCTNLILEESYCVKPVGSISTYSGYGGTSTDACSRARGPTTCYRDVSDLPTGTLVTETPNARGTTKNCDKFVTWRNSTFGNSTGPDLNTCDYIKWRYEITWEQLKAWNPSLNTTDPSCAIKNGYKYCVQGPGYTTPSSSSDFADLTPTSTVSGTAADCTSWGIVSGTNKSVTCDSYAKDWRITRQQLVSWNSWIESDCSGFYKYIDKSGHETVCIGAGTSATMATGSSSSISSQSITSQPASTPTDVPASSTTLLTGTSTPTPVQTGITSSCGKFYKVVTGDSCHDIAQEHDVTLDDFYAWNPAVGDNCGSLLSGYYVCVGLKS